MIGPSVTLRLTQLPVFSCNSRIEMVFMGHSVSHFKGSHNTSLEIPLQPRIKRAINQHKQQNDISTGLIERDNPVGHPSRRAEGIPLLITKFTHRLERHYPTRRLRRILAAVANQERFLEMPVTDFTDLLAP